MEVTWKYDVKNVGGGDVFIPRRGKAAGGHVNLTGERDSDIYPVSRLVSPNKSDSPEEEVSELLLRFSSRDTSK